MTLWGSLVRVELAQLAGVILSGLGQSRKPDDPGSNATGIRIS